MRFPKGRSSLYSWHVSLQIGSRTHGPYQLHRIQSELWSFLARWAYAPLRFSESAYQTTQLAVLGRRRACLPSRTACLLGHLPKFPQVWGLACQGSLTCPLPRVHRRRLLTPRPKATVTAANVPHLGKIISNPASIVAISPRWRNKELLVDPSDQTSRLLRLSPCHHLIKFDITRK